MAGTRERRRAREARQERWYGKVPRRAGRQVLPPCAAVRAPRAACGVRAGVPRARKALLEVEGTIPTGGDWRCDGIGNGMR